MIDAAAAQGAQVRNMSILIMYMYVRDSTGEYARLNIPHVSLVLRRCE